MATNPLGKRNSIMGGLNHPHTNWDDPHPHNKCSGPPYMGYLYKPKYSKFMTLTPHVGGESMATNPLGKRNSIIGGLNHPPINWDDPHLHNKCSGPPYMGYLYTLK